MLHQHKFFKVTCFCLTLCTLVVALPAARAQGDDTFEPNEVVVKLVSPAVLGAVARAHRLKQQPLDQFGTRPIYRLGIEDGTNPEDKAKELLEDPQRRIVYAEPNYVAQAPEGRKKSSWAIGGTATEYATQWAPTKIGLGAAHSLTRGEELTVAVIDTGVDPTHPALRDKLVVGYDFVDDDANPREEGRYAPTDPGNVAFGHGTHVAGLVALVAPEARIMPIRVLEPDGTGNVWVLAEAIRYAADHGARVLNLSIGTTRETRLINDVLEAFSCDDEPDPEDVPCADSRRRGLVVVAAAGNNGNTVPEYPAAENEHELLAVAASTQNDRLAPFSTRGSWIQLAAPGERIVSTVPGGGYATWSGTSMAAPLAAGAAALLRSHCPVLDARAVVRRLKDTAVPIADEPGGRLAVAAALTGACSTTMLPLIFK
jgi:thermitase